MDFQPSDGNAKRRRVLRVLELDGQKLADPLSLGAIRAILGICTNLDTFRRGPGVFDLLDDDQVN